jgi:hypothetical protein
MPAGVEYSFEIAAEICDKVASGMKLVDVLKAHGLPTRSTFYLWMREHDGVSDMYARAREERAELIADEIIDIADNEPDPNKARVRVDARKWAAAKLNPKQYGDRLHVDGDFTVKRTDEQIDSRVAQLLGKAGIAALTRGEGTEETAS